ncbi:MAG: amidohydrolase family protein [Thermodesulfobacteriota bacterium]
MMSGLVLDGHVHCGLELPFETVLSEWEQADIDGGVMFSPVEEIYDRYDPRFRDSPQYRRSREEVHRYLLGLLHREHLFAYYFIWNDFPAIPGGFVGIKWHRHAGEPVYDYETAACARAVEEICQKRLPIVLEEEFDHTVSFIRRIAGRTVVIVPHMGLLNGGYGRLKGAGVFSDPQVWVDTALASRDEIRDFAQTYGVDRMIFGSDFPFGLPYSERSKVEAVFSGEELRSVLSGNLLRLLGKEGASDSPPVDRS